MGENFVADQGYVYVGATKWRGGTVSGVFRMPIGSGKWEECNDGFPEEIHVQSVIVHPGNPEVLIAGTSDGVYRSNNRGKGWTRLNVAERNRQIWSVYVDPTNHKRIFAGASPVEVFKSEDGGESWKSIPSSKIASRIDTGKFVNRVFRIAVDYTNNNNVFGASEVNGMMLSSDGGETWRDGNDPLLAMVEARPELHSAILTPFAVEGILDMHSMCCTPAEANTNYVACRMGIFKTSDNGKTWRDLNIRKYSPYAYGRDIKVSPHDPRTLYACVSVASHGETGAVYKTTDLGETWSRFDHSVKPHGTMMAVSIHPKDPNKVFAATRAGQVFGTNDAGKTWSTYLLPEGCEGLYSLACGV